MCNGRRWQPCPLGFGRPCGKANTASDWCLSVAAERKYHVLTGTDWLVKLENERQWTSIYVLASEQTWTACLWVPWSRCDTRTRQEERFRWRHAGRSSAPNAPNGRRPSLLSKLSQNWLLEPGTQPRSPDSAVGDDVSSFFSLVVKYLTCLIFRCFCLSLFQLLFATPFVRISCADGVMSFGVDFCDFIGHVSAASPFVHACKGKAGQVQGPANAPHSGACSFRPCSSFFSLLCSSCSSEAGPACLAGTTKIGVCISIFSFPGMSRRTRRAQWEV